MKLLCPLYIVVKLFKCVLVEERLSELWAKQKVKKLNCERHTERERSILGLCAVLPMMIEGESVVGVGGSYLGRFEIAPPGRLTAGVLESF